MRKFAFILFLFLAGGLALAEETNRYCILCGNGPLKGRVWISKWGTVCDDCYHKYENRCSLCGLPLDHDYVKTGDGRYICRFDKTNAVLDVDGAKDVFAEVRRDMVELYGNGFTLQYPDVTVSLFDVDYWSEKGREDGLHKFGFASSRKNHNGEYTHEVMMLSGRLRTELSATAAHEYTHLWINENCPADHVIEPDTVEGICELSAYKLMESRGDTVEDQKILDNPYTHGEIKKLVALEQDRGIAYILDWVKNGTGGTLDEETAALAVPARPPRFVFTNVPPPPPRPQALEVDGILINGSSRQVIVSGVLFGEGETQTVTLRDGPVEVRCEQVLENGAILVVNGQRERLAFQPGGEKNKP